MTDLTELLNFIAPGAAREVSRWGENNNDLWDLTDSATTQATIDAVVTWNDGITPPTGQQVFDGIPGLVAAQKARTDYLASDQFKDDQVDAELSLVDRKLLKAVVLWAANLHSISPSQARNQIKTIYRSL